MTAKFVIPPNACWATRIECRLRVSTLAAYQVVTTLAQSDTKRTEQAIARRTSVNDFLGIV